MLPSKQLAARSQQLGYCHSVDDLATGVLLFVVVLLLLLFFFFFFFLLVAVLHYPYRLFLHWLLHICYICCCCCSYRIPHNSCSIPIQPCSSTPIHFLKYSYAAPMSIPTQLPKYSLTFFSIPRQCLWFHITPTLFLYNPSYTYLQLLLVFLCSSLVQLT